VSRAGAIAVHPTCSGRHLGMDRRLRKLAVELADDVFVPPSAGCCGFAGDRGFLHPELTASATQEEAAEVKGRHFDAHVSTNRTCEIGMERATDRPYVHVVQLLEQLSRPRSAA
jgi:D-lactate dehydrogenase